MAKRFQSSDADELKRLNEFKRTDDTVGAPLGAEVLGFFKQSVAKRQTKFSKLADVWEVLVPRLLAEHCALDSFSRGTLTVLVDSSAHLYDLKQLLLAGLEKQLLLACRSSGLRKIALKSGRWYEGADSADRRPRFD